MTSESWIYRDPVEGFSGFLTICGESRSLAAGGLRVQQGLSGETILTLAQLMNAKERALGINAGGAKCGIDYDPGAPGKRAAVGRFLNFLRPFLEQRLSLGPDMGTNFAEIETLAQEMGIASVKSAAGRAQGMSSHELLTRMRILARPVGALTLGERRAGHGLAHATLAAWNSAFPHERPSTVAVQGFGTLGRAAALTLYELGLRVIAIADEHGCIQASTEINVQRLLVSSRDGVLESKDPNDSPFHDRSSIFEAPADILVLAACENAASPLDVPRVAARLIAIGANHGISPLVENELCARGHVVLPDLVAGAGGSAAMDALLAPTSRPDAESVLRLTAMTMARLSGAVIAEAADRGISSREAAISLSEKHEPDNRAKPYGLRTIHDLSTSKVIEDAPVARSFTHVS